VAASTPLNQLFYDSSMIYRDLEYVRLSSAREITVTNHGSAAVDMTIYAESVRNHNDQSWAIQPGC
jgi:hypothetical protein